MAYCNMNITMICMMAYTNLNIALIYVMVRCICQAQPQLNSYSIQFNFNNQCLVASELQKDFFRLVFGFSTKKCQNYVFTEFCQKIMHIIEQMLVLFSLSLIGS